MITIELNDQTADDVKCIQELQDLGLSNELIQELYDSCLKKRKDGINMNDVIVHAYVEPDLKNLKTNENVDCCNCMMAEKTQLLDGGEGYLCKAALYDIKTLSCFVPKERGDDVQTNADNIRSMSDEELAHELSLVAGWDRTQYNEAKRIGIETVMLNWLREPVKE